MARSRGETSFDGGEVLTTRLPRGWGRQWPKVKTFQRTRPKRASRPGGQLLLSQYTGQSERKIRGVDGTDGVRELTSVMAGRAW